MLQSTFTHLSGISTQDEKKLWSRGILTWKDYRKKNPAQLSLLEKTHQDRLAPSFVAYTTGDVSYFTQRLHPHQYFRIALSYPNDVLFLDIETTGLSLYYHSITLVGWSLGTHYDFILDGTSPDTLYDAMAQAKVLVTFNGTLFDLKFLQKTYTDLKLPPCHIDLRFFAKRLGLTGGQKSIEDIVGYARSQEAKEVDGGRAPILWYKYQHGESDALKQLLVYNYADVVGMKFIFDACIERYCTKEDYPQRILPKFPFFSKQETRFCTKKQLSALPPYTGQIGPKVTYQALRKTQFAIAGIDLVASEEKESGFCILRENKAFVARCKSDAEMIARIQEEAVGLVSIDSPLCLPVGRTTVFDSDPLRKEKGITRHCERVLKRRGVSVYPCLIPSMQKLTARGIAIAEKLRALGIPVIESYPGGAQDILGIPRKQAGIDYLKKGLEDFGIQGSFLETSVSHDELDAITSALVGLFFWTGQFEALGTEEEAPLIIPALSARDAWPDTLVFAISGGAKHSTGTSPCILRVELADTSAPLTRKDVQILKNYSHVVLDGISFPQDHATLLEEFGPKYIHIHDQSHTTDIHMQNLAHFSFKESITVQDTTIRSIHQ